MKLKKSMSILMCMGLACSMHTVAVNAAQTSTVAQWTCDFDLKSDTEGYSNNFNVGGDSCMQTPFDTAVEPRTVDNASITGLRTIGMNGDTAKNAELGFCAAGIGNSKKTKLGADSKDRAYGAFYVKLNSDSSDNNFALGVNAVKSSTKKEGGQTVTFTRDAVKPEANQSLVMTFDNITYVADTDDDQKNGYTTIAFKSSSDAEIVSYTVAYIGTSADNAVIKDIKIGGTQADGTIKQAASVQSDNTCLNSLSNYADGTTKNGKVTITMTAGGATAFEYTTPAGDTSTFEGTVTDTEIAKLVITAANDDSARMYCIDNLVTIISENDESPEITAADKYDFETDTALANPDAIGFTASFVPETTLNSLTWYLSNDGGKSYKELIKGNLPEITGNGEVKVGLIVYDLPISADNLSAGYSVE